MSSLPKPVLRGHVARYGLKLIAGAVTFGAINGGLYYLFVALRHKLAYNDFIKFYDPKEHYEELSRIGYFRPVDKD